MKTLRFQTFGSERRSRASGYFLNKIINARIKSAKQHGIWVGARDTDNYDNEIIFPWIKSAIGNGIHVGDEVTANKCHGLKIINPSIFDCGDIGVRIFHAKSGSIEGPLINGGIISRCTNSGLFISDSVNNALITGLRISGNGDYGVTLMGSNCQVVNNTIIGHTTENIRYLGVGNIVMNVIGNTAIVDAQYFRELTFDEIKANENGVRSWLVKALGGDITLTSGDGFGALNVVDVKGVRLPIRLTANLLPTNVINDGIIYIENSGSGFKIVCHIGDEIKKVTIA